MLFSVSLSKLYCSHAAKNALTMTPQADKLFWRASYAPPCFITMEMKVRIIFIISQLYKIITVGTFSQITRENHLLSTFRL